VCQDNRVLGYLGVRVYEGVNGQTVTGVHHSEISFRMALGCYGVRVQ